MLRLGTRGSKLAIIQAQEVAKKLEKLGTECEIVKIKTTGDLINDKPLVDIGGKALFLKEIEEYLISGKIDIAVHSLKDIPAILPCGLTIAAVTERLPPQDVLISHSSLEALPIGSTIGTCAVRRKAFINHFFKGKFNIVDLRGNIDTRIEKFLSGSLDGIVVAQSGIERLNLSHYISEIIPVDKMLPAIGQGVVAIECRESDYEIVSLLNEINDSDTYDCITAERAFMIEIGGNCKTPMAALAKIRNGNIELQAAFAVPDGSYIFKVEVIDNRARAYKIGVEAAEKIKDEIIKSQYFHLVRDLFHID
jgi:hydroxymethylbilane synthase